MTKKYEYKEKDQVIWEYNGQLFRIVERRFDTLIGIPLYAIRGKDGKVIRYIAEYQLYKPK